MDTASQTLTLAATVGHINLSDRDDTGKQLARVLLAQQIEREEDSTCFDISKDNTRVNGHINLDANTHCILGCDPEQAKRGKQSSSTPLPHFFLTTYHINLQYLS